MEKNTVLLGVEKYNELRDFKKEIEAGKSYVIKESWFQYGHNTSSISFYTESEIVEEIDKKNKELVSKNQELLDKIEKLTNVEPKQIQNLKKMSYWKFRKWKNS